MSKAAPSITTPVPAPQNIANPPETQRFNRLDLALVLNMALWGGNFVVSKAATDALPPMTYNALRFGVALIVFYAMTRALRVDLRLPRREWRPVVVAAFIGYALYQPAFINGLHHTSVGNSVLIVSAGPVWVVLFNAWRSQERITRGTLIGIMIALGGVLVVIIGRYAGQIGIDTTTLVGDGLMLIASFFWAWSLIASREPLSRHDTLPVTFWLLAVGTVLQGIEGAPDLLATRWSAVDGGVIVAIIYSGAISISIAGLIFNYAIGKIGATRTAVYSYLQPLVAAGLAIVVLHEAFTPWLIVGGVLIFAGVALVRRV